jgi:hypothetical protein
VVKDETVESLVRNLAEHLDRWSGVPLLCVFDRPKTVALKWQRNGEVTEWNPVFAYAMLEMGIGVELCWPYRPQEKEPVGYLTYGPDAANMLFHVVNDRHLRKRPMIFTTNKPLTEWGKVLHDEDMAAAILDRVLERGRFIHLDGPSGRTRHLNLEEILPAGTDRARISGIGAPEFPEPTNLSVLQKEILSECQRPSSNRVSDSEPRRWTSRAERGS